MSIFNPLDNPLDKPATSATPEVKTPFDATPPGVGFNTVKGLTLGLFPGMLKDQENPYVSVGKSILQGLFRIGGQAALTGMQAVGAGLDKLTGQNRLPNMMAPVQQQGGSQYLFGNEPLESYASIIERRARAMQTSDFAKKIGLDKHAWPIAFAGTLAPDALNFLGGEGEGAIIKQIVKETDPAKIFTLLIKHGVEKQVAARAANSLASISDPEEVKTALETIQGINSIFMNGKEVGAKLPLDQQATELFHQIHDSPPADMDIQAAMRYANNVAALSGAKEIGQAHALEGLQHASADVSKLNTVPVMGIFDAASTAAHKRAAMVGVEGLDPEVPMLVDSLSTRLAKLPNKVKKTFHDIVVQKIAMGDGTMTIDELKATDALLSKVEAKGKAVTAQDIYTSMQEPSTAPVPAKASEAKQYPTIHEGGVIKMVDGEPVKIVDGVETFLHKGDGGWIVSESSTGRFLADGRTKEGVIAKAKFNISHAGKDNFLKLLKEHKLPEDLEQKYMEIIAKEYRGADNVLSADSAKSIYPEYNGANAQDFHEGASAFVKKLYPKWLKERAGTKNNTVLFTAGGTGSGKTTALLKNGIDIKDYPIVYDGNFASDQSIARAKQALDAGYNVQIVYVHRSPVEAFVNGVLPRAVSQKRIVPIVQHLERHELSLPTVLKARDELAAAGNKLEVIAIDNTNGPGKAAVSTLENLPKYSYNGEDLKSQLYAATEQFTKPGGISPEQASAITEGVSAPPRGGTGGQLEPQRTGAGEPTVSVGEGTQASAEDLAQVPKEIRQMIETPAVALSEFAKGPESKSWQSLIKGYMYNYAPEKRVHLLDYLATPEYVLEKVGLGRGADLLHTAQDVYRNTLDREIETISKWHSRVGTNPHVSQILFRYLDGREKDMVREMTPEEHEVAREIRDYLQKWAQRLHLPEDNQISRYITHIFERDFNGKDSFVDPELSAIMSDNVAKSVYDPFLQKRTGKPGYIEDVWRALDAYVKRASRKEAMDPALDELSKMAEKVDESTFKYVKELSHRVNMRPTELEKGLDSLLKQTPIGYKFTERPTAYLTRFIRHRFFQGTLGGNVSSAVRNLGQGANTYAKLGEKWTTVGYTKLLTRMMSNNLQELYDVHVLDDQLVQDRFRKAIEQSTKYTGFKLDDALFSFFQTAEKINRGSAYFGAKAKALSEGLSEEQAIKYAKRIVRETQFAFGAVDTPVALNDDLVKTLFQLQTYNVKQAEFLGRMAKQKDFLGLTRWSLGSFVMLMTLGKLIGMTPRQLIPTIGFGGAPLTSTVNALTGVAGGPTIFAQNPQDKAAAENQLKRNLFTLLPGGAQIRKTLQGAGVLLKGKDTTPKGKTRFEIDNHDPATIIRALLFGKSNLPEAQEYYDSLDQKKPAAATGNPLD